MLRSFLFYGCLLAASHLAAQSDSTAFSKLLSNYKLKTSVGLQFWSTYSQDMQVYDQETETFSKVDNRLNAQLRRSRFTISGQPYANLTFKITAAVDLLGHDLLAATEAGGNNGSSPKIRVWNAFTSINLLPGKDLLHLTTGYFVSPIGRESNIAALRSTSFEKAWSQNYLRRHLTGIGPGRAMGTMLGGQLSNQHGKLHLSYEAAIQNPVPQAFGGNSSGTAWSPLLVGKLSAHFGDAEQDKYGLSHKLNYFGKRQGLTLSLAGAHQGETDQFISNGAYGLEVLYNTSTGFHLDGEYFILKRSVEGTTQQTVLRSSTGYLRAGKNINLPMQLVIEPVVSYWFFQGATTEVDIRTANQQGYFAGQDEGVDIGANLYFNPNLKLSLFYAHRAGNSGEGNPSEINNNFYWQPGVGRVQRGSYFGTGLVVII